jgi:AcrR family transcriptional regulator
MTSMKRNMPAATLRSRLPAMQPSRHASPAETPPAKTGRTANGADLVRKQVFAEDGTARKRDAVRTRAKILEAAMDEFAARGLPDARIEDVAQRAGANRRMIYYYFGSKEGLYLAALEAVYDELIQEERKIDVNQLGPVEAITAMIDLKIDHYVRYPRFIAFLNMENLYRARHLKTSKRLRDFKTPLTEVLGRVLANGQRAGLFRTGIDPVDLYISICALGYMYFSNQHTLGVIFGRKLTAPDALKLRKATIADIVVSYLTRGARSKPGRRSGTLGMDQSCKF